MRQNERVTVTGGDDTELPEVEQLNSDGQITLTDKVQNEIYAAGRNAGRDVQCQPTFQGDHVVNNYTALN